MSPHSSDTDHGLAATDPRAVGSDLRPALKPALGYLQQNRHVDVEILPWVALRAALRMLLCDVPPLSKDGRS
jgi:hypothetical protein